MEGTKILRETWQNKTLIPLYDNQDQVCGISYNGRLYSFLKNLQGDVVALVDEQGETVARYSYDAWGVPTVLEDHTDFQITRINPFLYRGYYYDWEIGMYYLQSRYYDPVVGRFLNGDDAELVSMDENLFQYCYNSPVVRIDLLGYGWILITVIAIVAVVTVAHVVNAGVSLSQADYNKKHDTKKIVSNQKNIDMKMGAKKFSQMGCGIAATHNAILLAGGTSSLADVVKFMQSHDLTLGFVGVYFTNIQLFVKRKGYSNKIYLTKLKDSLDKKIKNCTKKIAILAYKHSTGGHYVAIKYNTETEKFQVYNTNRTLASVDKWIKDNNYKPLSLITI